jgi:hypothetical protein
MFISDSLHKSNYKSAVSPMSNHIAIMVFRGGSVNIVLLSIHHIAIMAFRGGSVNTVLLSIQHIEKFQIKVRDLTKFYAIFYIMHKWFLQ